jgi:hypothetical protein
MIDHYLDLALAQEPGLASLPPQQRDVAREMKRALKRGDKRFAKVELRCEAEVTTSERSCAMDAKTPAEWEACVRIAGAP